MKLPPAISNRKTGPWSSALAVTPVHIEIQPCCVAAGEVLNGVNMRRRSSMVKTEVDTHYFNSSNEIK